MKVEVLGRVGGPVFLVSDVQRTTNVGVAYMRPGNVVRKVRGGKCRDVRGLMSEFGAAFQFFDGFGENWHALEECLCYLDEWLPGEGYVIVVEAAEALLCEAPDELRWFVAVMADVARWWSEPISGNGRHNRPARSFQVVFELTKDEGRLTSRLRAAGGTVAKLSV